jgi:peptide chain release factor 2
MSFLILRKSLRSSKVSSQNPRISFLFSYGSPSFSYKTTEAPSGSRRLSHLIPEKPIRPSGSPIYRHSFSGIYSNSLPSIKNLSQFRESPIILTLFRYFGTEAAVLPSTADGLTVEGILASNWTILDESESDWKSHAAAIAQSIHLIKKRLKVCHVI